MFDTAELGRKTTKREYKQRATPLREALLQAQASLRAAGVPVIVLFGGVDGAGKGDAVNALNEWMDPRWMKTVAFDEPSQEEEERPEYWRFWRALPAKGHISLLLSAWYSQPLLRRIDGGQGDEFERSLEQILAFEQQLADDGALILKYWLHLGKKGQHRRFERLEADPLQSWRVTERDWENWRKYDDFIAAGERIITRTSTGDAPWHIVEGVCSRYASLRVGGLLLEAIENKLADVARQASADASDAPHEPHSEASKIADPDDRLPITILSTLDSKLKLKKPDYRRQLAIHQGRINQLQKRARDQGASTILVFEGWDAAGKGGAIRRINASLDSRAVQVIPVAAPTDEESAHHYLWRFWRHLGRAGRVSIFDRSWYGRVLVERVEGFATEKEWQRAYAEINRFEQELVDHGIVLLKFWLHITPEEQLRRFKEREETPYKQWKLTDEDWRNRERWDDYEIAVHDMVERTSTLTAPWVLVEGNDKPFARVKVLESICNALEARVGAPDPPPPDAEAAAAAPDEPSAIEEGEKTS